MKITTNGRELNDAINGVAGGADLGVVGDEHRLALAQALTSLARCVDTQTDREITLSADVKDNAATVSIVIGQKRVAPPEVEAPFENPHWADVEAARIRGSA
jgi:hypothetical protein